MTPKGFADRMVAQGVRVFALPAGSKSPYPGTHGCLEADLETGYWLAHPEDGVGVACGGTADPHRFLLAIDLDSHGGGTDGIWSLARYPYVMGMPDTLWVATPTGGHHAYYFVDSPVAGGSNAKLQIDLRGTGGYVVGAGSRHPNGGRYEVFWDAPIADANVAVYKFVSWYANGGTFHVELPKPRLAPYTGERRMPEFHGNDDRNSSLASFAGSMIARGFSLDETIDEMRRVNASHYAGHREGPKPDREVEKIANSIWRSHQRNHPGEGR